jgi:hypothetical protein
MYEKFSEPLAPMHRFISRLLKCFAFGLLLTLLSLIVGMVGYHFFEEMPWIDTFTNASMILSGMGPLSPLFTTTGKIFAGCYALFSGLIFTFIIGFVFSPVIHRFLHSFHLNTADKKD